MIVGLNFATKTVIVGFKINRSCYLVDVMILRKMISVNCVSLIITCNFGCRGAFSTVLDLHCCMCYGLNIIVKDV